MKTGPRIAAAVAVGYVLGRTRRMKMAITVGGILAGRRLGFDPKHLVQQGRELLASSPEFSELSTSVRGQLLEAARTAATAVASNKIEALGSSLSERAAKVRESGSGAGSEDEAPEQAGRSDEEAGAEVRRPRSREDDQRRPAGSSERRGRSGSGPPRRPTATGSSGAARRSPEQRPRGPQPPDRPRRPKRGGEDG